MKIAMISFHSSPLGKLGTQDTGGMSVYIRELSRELGKAGHSIDIFTRAEEENREEKVMLSQNVQLIYLTAGPKKRMPKNSLYPLIPEFVKSLDEYRIQNAVRFDLIHSHYWLSGCAGALAQEMWGVPHVLTFHTTGMAKNESCSKEKEPRLRIVEEKKLARSCTRILAPTERELTLINRFYSVPSDKTGIVPCGVNLETFHPVSKSISRKRLGLPKENPLVLFIGRFAPVKGIERLMTAMKYVEKKTGITLMIVGGDSGSDSTLAFQEHANKLGILNNILFAGSVRHEDLIFYYNAADLLVVPSYYESFGLVALESLACGTPVIATRVGAMDSIIQNGKSGEILDSPGPREIAAAIEQVIAQQRKSPYSPAEIRETIRTYNWSNIASAVAKEYSSAMQTHNNRAPRTKSDLKGSYDSVC